MPSARARSASCLALALALTALVALAGCGGGSGGDEDALRSKLEAGVAKLEEAKSLTATVIYEVVADAEESTEPEGACVNVHVERGPPARVDIVSFGESAPELGCAGGAEGSEVLIVGNRAWVTGEPGVYRAAKISPELARSVTDESDKFSRLLAAASDLAEGGEGAAIEADGSAHAASTYHFTAPASSFSDSPGSDSTDVDFEATVDRHGYLRELVARIEEDGSSVTVTQTYEDLGRDFEIGPPPAGEVNGPTLRIESRKQLQALLGSPAV